MFWTIISPPFILMSVGQRKWMSGHARGSACRLTCTDTMGTTALSRVLYVLCALFNFGASHGLPITIRRQSSLMGK